MQWLFFMSYWMYFTFFHALLTVIFVKKYFFMPSRPEDCGLWTIIQPKHATGTTIFRSHFLISFLNSFFLRALSYLVLSLSLLLHSYYKYVVLEISTKTNKCSEVRLPIYAQHTVDLMALCTFPMTPPVRLSVGRLGDCLVGWTVGRSVCHNFLNLHFHAFMEHLF